MQSTANKIEEDIRRRRRGKIYFADDFSAFGSPEAIKKTLLRLEGSGILIRLAHGIYLYPTLERKLGLGVLYPSADQVAKEIASRDKARIVPTGSYALNALGLSTQVPMNIVYHTDGAPRNIRIYNQQIKFKHVSPKNLAYKSEILMLVVSALKEIGEGKVNDKELAKIKEVLSHETKEKVLNDLSLAPAWIRKIIIQLI